MEINCRALSPNDGGDEGREPDCHGSATGILNAFRVAWCLSLSWPLWYC